ncbi:hypothetical protein RBG61_12935 [Paludicola sp. MB14-C6]|uniref:hypothetical protein n=1 Tax=Paludihabitans sp. MB14-C6 TaxID=3070656 RepID=UPI0027DD5B95|nr:hypothetical protein [Paludicola sp. MB14-C6]WMJ22881.1 hypothetical protein RBG61_12935 [Paludicola sp. MB14-C6]
MFKRFICITLVLALLFTSQAVSAASISAQQYDVAINTVNLADTIRENESFIVETNLSYYAINKGSWTSSSSWVNCGGCGGSGRINCSTCSGTGSLTKYRPIPCQAPSNPKCQSSCNGTDYKCRYCSFTASTGSNRCPKHGNTCGIPDHKCDCPTGKTQAYTISCSSCSSGKRTCPDCSGSGGYYISSSSWVKPVKPTPCYVVVEYYYNGSLQKSENYTIPITKENASTASNGTGYEVWGDLTVSTSLKAIGGIGVKPVEIRVNYSDRSKELVSTNNVKTSSINVVSAVPNLDVEFIEPNADYRKDTEVISTFLINNKDSKTTFDITPANKLVADFTAIHPTTGAVVATATVQDIVIPKMGSNIVYFKWSVPISYNSSSIKVRCSVSLAVDRSKTKYVVGTNTVSENLNSDTPNTIFESNPKDYNIPSSTTPVNTKPFAKLNKSSISYEMWAWENEWYKKKTYSVSLDETVQLTPDTTNPSSMYNAAKNIWISKSGYGITLKGVSDLSSPYGLSAPTNAYNYPQRAIALFPEFSYVSEPTKFSTLKCTKLGEFTFIPNKFAVNQNSVHFIPVWFPNGTYAVKLYSYDCWTPAGMLSAEAIANNLFVNGNMYDDWYVGK